MNSGKYIPTLDGWRALAVCGVLEYHASGYFFSQLGLYPNPTAHAYMSHGSLGVDVFFVLSGFLICTGLTREYAATGTIGLRAFYLRRAFRILPPYLLYLLTVALLGRLVSGLELASCLLFFRNLIHAPGAEYTAHFWTLAVEEHFYLAFPVLLFVANKWRPVVALFALMLPFSVVKLPGEESRIAELIVGAWLALLTQTPVVRLWARRVPTAVCLPLAALVVWHAAHPLPWLILPLALGAMIVLTSLAPSSPVGRLLELGPVRHVGRLSYSLYLWQQMFLVLDTAPGSNQLGRVQQWPWAPLALVACALGSYYAVERPCIMLGRRVSGGAKIR